CLEPPPAENHPLRRRIHDPQELPGRLTDINTVSLPPETPRRKSVIPAVRGPVVAGQGPCPWRPPQISPEPITAPKKKSGSSSRTCPRRKIVIRSLPLLRG